MTTSLAPVFTAIGVYGTQTLSFAAYPASSALLTSAFGTLRTKVSDSGNARAPSVTTVTSMLPTL